MGTLSTNRGVVSSTRSTASAPSRSQSYFVVLMVKVLLVLVILFMLPKLVFGSNPAKARKTRYEYELRTMRTNCATQTCSYIEYAEEAMNCLLVCVSPACYQQIYSTNPLEEGEIDLERAITFERCVKDELRILRQRKKDGVVPK